VGAGLLLLLGANTLLLLDQLFLISLREMARQQGWYGERRALQFGAVIVAVTAGLLVLGWLRTRLEMVWTQCGWAVIGLCGLVGLVTTRCISFHFTDLVMNLRLGGFTVGRWFEAGGLLLVIAGTRQWLRVH
jgi:hypothetical protein